MEHEQIFLSYRRSDGSDKARLLKIFLERCGYSVFMDIEIKRYGDFPAELEEKIRNCLDFIFVLTPDACVYRSGADQEEDFLFKELRCAYSLYEENRAKAENRGEGALARLSPRIHIVSAGDLIGRFKQVSLPEDYPKEVIAFFGSKTPQEKCLDFSQPDSVIESMFREEKYLDLLSEPYVPDADGTDCPPGELRSGCIPTREEELSRQKIQNALLAPSVKGALESVLVELGRRLGKSSFTVLDVGCGTGTNEKLYFSDDRFSGVVGVDKEMGLITECRENLPQNGKYCFERVDLVDPLLGGTLDRILRDLGIEGFDIIFCSQVMHHILKADKRKEILDALVKRLAPNGCLIIVGSDDGAKLSYLPGKGNFIVDVLRMTRTVKTVSDRHYGRRIHSDLLRAGLVDVTVAPLALCTSQFAGNLRQNYVNRIFKSSFEWRKSIFEDEIEKKRGDKELLEARLREMEKKLGEVRECLQSGWYMEIDFFGYGFKDDLGIV